MKSSSIGHLPMGQGAAAGPRPETVPQLIVTITSPPRSTLDPLRRSCWISASNAASRSRYEGSAAMRSARMRSVAQWYC